jgi:two-component SAPR family response regulator
MQGQIGPRRAGGSPMNIEPEPAPPEDGASDALNGRRILVVEDETWVAFDLEAILKAAGCIVIGPAANLRDGLDLAEQNPLDAALLDINLGYDQSFPIAYGLKRRGIPFVFVTAYSNYILPAGLMAAPLVTKPYTDSTLRQAIASAIAWTGSPRSPGPGRS